MQEKLFPLLTLFLLPHLLRAQTDPDTTFITSAINHAKTTYIRGLANHTHLHNGVEHKHYRDEVESKAYLDPDWTDGQIVYDQELFGNVPLLYDLIAQRVITDFKGQTELELITDKVDWFTVNKRKFIYLNRDKKESITSAFYEVLTEGHVKLYAQRRKRIIEKVGEKNITYTVSTTNHFFLYKDGKYIPVNGKGSLIAALRDKKAELKQFQKESNISFSKETRETALKQYVTRYNELHKHAL